MFRLTIIALFVLAHITGCILNLIALVSVALHGAPVTALVLFRIVGLFFPPLGALLGWFA